MPVDVAGFAYAAVVAAGGVFGYYKAGKVHELLDLDFTQNENYLSII